MAAVREHNVPPIPPERVSRNGYAIAMCNQQRLHPNNNQSVQQLVQPGDLCGPVCRGPHARPCCAVAQVMAFDNRKEADDFMQSRQKHVLGAVHFINSPTKQLQYIIQSNTSVST